MKILLSRPCPAPRRPARPCAAAGVVVVAVAFAIYAFAKTYLGPAGGSAVTALVFAVGARASGVLLASSAAGKGQGPRSLQACQARRSPSPTA